MNLHLHKLLALIFSIGLVAGLVAQDEEAVGDDAAADTTATEEEGAEMDDMSMEEELLEYEEEEASSGLDGFSAGLTASVGFVNGEFITNTPIGGSLIVTTPYGFALGNLGRFNISLAFGSYSGKSDPGTGEVDINPSAFGVGGNLTLAKMIFAEGHAGLVGDGPGIRGFAGVSLERIMKKSLGLPVNVLVGGEGFISTQLAADGEKSYWGGIGARLDYAF